MQNHPDAAPTENAKHSPSKLPLVVALVSVGIAGLFGGLLASTSKEIPAAPVAIDKTEILAGQTDVAKTVVAAEMKAFLDDAAFRAKADEAVVRVLAERPELILESIKALEMKKAEARAKAGDGRRQEIENVEAPISWGPADAPVTIVEFSDYNCGWCRKEVAELNKLLAKRGDVRLIVRQFPVITPSSRDVAHVAQTIAEMDPSLGRKFHEEAFGPHPKPTLDKAAAIEIARKLGVDVAKLELRMLDPNSAKPIIDTLNLGRELEVGGTPTFFINGKRFESFLDAERLEAIVEQAAVEAKARKTATEAKEPKQVILGGPGQPQDAKPIVIEVPTAPVMPEPKDVKPIVIEVPTAPVTPEPNDAKPIVIEVPTAATQPGAPALNLKIPEKTTDHR
jgi:protein-disulfide isomerase